MRFSCRKYSAFFLVFLFTILEIQCHAQSKLILNDSTKYKQLLIGRWQSIDDPKFTVVITSSSYTEQYTKTPPSRFSYSLKSSCNCDGATKVEAKGKPLLVTFEEVNSADCFCYSIDKLDDKSLTLLYIGRGNSLRFKRVK